MLNILKTNMKQCAKKGREKMKVTIVSPCDLPVPATKGGAVATLIENLINQNEINQHIDLTVISSYDKKAEEISQTYKNTKMVYIKEPKICEIIDKIYEKLYKIITKKEHKILKNYAWKLYVLRFLKKYFLKNSTDKIVLQNSGYLLNILKNKKIIEKYKENIYYHLHNDVPDNIYIEGMKICKLILISKYLSHKLINMCGKDIEKKILILKNGFNCKQFQQKLTEKEKIELKEKLKISKDKKIIIFTGRITEEKGILELTEAIKNLKNNNISLLVVGSHNFGGDNTSEFEQRMKNKFASLGDTIKFTGYIPYKDIWKYYKIADLAVLPSTWQEPAGLTMLEASASGIPLITTNSGGIPEYLNKTLVTMIDLEKNVTKEIENNIKYFLDDEAKYKKRAKEASEYVCSTYTEQQFYNKFIEIINQK